MFSFDGIVRDTDEALVPGALVYIHLRGGDLADLTDSLGAPVANPLTTDSLGYYQAWVADSDFYTRKVYYGGRLRYVETSLVGNDPVQAAQDAASAAQAVGRYYATRAAGVAATAVGDMFTSDEGGTLSFYKHTGTTPFYMLYDTVPTSTLVNSKVATADLASTAALKGAALTGFNAANSYSAGTVGKALADLYGQHSTSIATNPALDGALVGFAPDGNSTKTWGNHYRALSGSRTKAVVGECFSILDAQTGPASGAGISTADSASYGLSIVGSRDAWNTSGRVGEMDGISVFLRQASGDSAAILSNVGGRSGFLAFTESYTFSADSSGAVVKAVNTQIGVVNPRDGGEYGMVVQAATGTIAVGYYVNDAGTAVFTDSFRHVRDGSIMSSIRGSDGAFTGGSLLPRTDRGAQIGTASLQYANAYLFGMTLGDNTFAGLPAAASSAGQIRYISNGSGAVGAAVSAGATAMFVASTGGANWMRMM